MTTTVWFIIPSYSLPETETAAGVSEIWCMCDSESLHRDKTHSNANCSSAIVLKFMKIFSVIQKCFFFFFWYINWQPLTLSFVFLVTRCRLNCKTTNPLIVVTNLCMQMEKKKIEANGKTQECFSDLSSTSLQHVPFLCLSFCIMDLVTDQWVGLVTLNVCWPVSCCRFDTFPLQ